MALEQHYRAVVVGDADERRNVVLKMGAWRPDEASALKDLETLLADCQAMFSEFASPDSTVKGFERGGIIESRWWLI